MAISYAIPENSYVSLNAYDPPGEEVTELSGWGYSAGIHSVTFSASRLASGVYFFAMRAGKFSTSEKMLLTK